MEELQNRGIGSLLISEIKRIAKIAKFENVRYSRSSCQANQFLREERVYKIRLEKGLFHKELSGAHNGKRDYAERYGNVENENLIAASISNKYTGLTPVLGNCYFYPLFARPLRFCLWGDYVDMCRYL